MKVLLQTICSARANDNRSLQWAFNGVEGVVAYGQFWIAAAGGDCQRALTVIAVGSAATHFVRSSVEPRDTRTTYT